VAGRLGRGVPLLFHKGLVLMNSLNFDNQM